MIEHPMLDEIKAKRAEIDAREVVLRALARALLDPYEVALAAWPEAVADALDLGAGPPARPDLPDTTVIDEEIRSLGFRREKLKLAERKVLAEIREEIEADRAAVIAASLDRARPGLDIVQAEMPILVEALRDVLAVRGAADLADPNARPAMGFGLRARSRQKITLPDVVDVLVHGGDLLAVAPTKPLPPEVPHIDAQVQQPPTGLTPPGAFGRPPAPEKRQRPPDSFA